MNMNTSIRPYQSSDKEALLNLLRLNTPAFFSPEEEVDLVYYLDHEVEYYYVLEVNQQLVGAGGINFSGNPAIGKISWDFLHPDFQGKGLGALLLTYRIEKLKTFAGLQKIIVRTSEQAHGFYEKSGFILLEIRKDYWAKGFDLYLMEYKDL